MIFLTLKKLLSMFKLLNLSSLPSSNPGSGRPWLHGSGSVVVGTFTGGGGGVTDHGALSGLGDDDHTQYFNASRLAIVLANYASLAHTHSAADVNSGTLDDARLSSNVPRLNAANAFTQTNTFNSGLVVPSTNSIFLSNGATTGNYILSGPTTAMVTNTVPQAGWNSSGLFVRALFLDYVNGDVRIVRNATGPTLQTQAAGGLRVTTEGTALGPVNSSTITVGVPGTGGIYTEVSNSMVRSYNVAIGFLYDLIGNDGSNRMQFRIGNQGYLQWQTTNRSDSGTPQLGFRNNAGTFEVNNGTFGQGGPLSCGTIRVGGGTVVQNILSATATLDFPAIAASSFADLTITVTGAVSGDTVIVNPIAGSATTDVVYTGWVSAANTVTIRASNVSSTTARDPASGTFRATVVRF